MSYRVLARKHRPQTFQEVVEQAHVTQTLKNAIETNRVAHAILFSGPRGTGKTTVARILAKAMNCEGGPRSEPCGECVSCREITGGNAADVFEIDGASNNGVEQIRELRENVRYMPSHSPHKIYIVDEVHMLSMAAFNALLKTLEEPPRHVLFLFATTEPQKIPVTILSRCQRHDLRRVSMDGIIGHLKRICEQENFEVPEKTLILVAREAGGSIRDSLSLLDQIFGFSDKKVDHDQVLHILGIIDRTLLFELADALFDHDLNAVLDIISRIHDRGTDMRKLHGEFTEHIRNLMVMKMGPGGRKLVDLPAHEHEALTRQAQNVTSPHLSLLFDILMKDEAVIRYSAYSKMAMEMTFVRMFHATPVLPMDTLIQKLDQLASKMPEIPAAQPGETQKRIHREPAAGPERVSKTEIPSPAPPPPSEEPVLKKVEGKTESGSNNVLLAMDTPLKEAWEKILPRLSQELPSIAPALASARLTKKDNQSLAIEITGNGFTMDRVKRKKSRQQITAVFESFFGPAFDWKSSPIPI